MGGTLFSTWGWDVNKLWRTSLPQGDVDLLFDKSLLIESWTSSSGVKHTIMGSFLPLGIKTFTPVRCHPPRFPDARIDQLENETKIETET